MISLIQANFTSTVQYMTQERDIAIRDRDKHHQQAIERRRENTMLQEQLTSYTRYLQAVRPPVCPPSDLRSFDIFVLFLCPGSARRNLLILWTGSKQ